MNKSRILSVALVASMVATVAAASTFGASAISTTSEIKDHSVGIVGSFSVDGGAVWNSDFPMTDDDGDGVYEGQIKLDSVAEDNLNADGKVEFKVRLDGSWEDSWGAYEVDDDRTYNSQTNCSVDATVGEPLTVNVKFYTTKLDAAALANPDSAAAGVAEDESANWGFLAIEFEVASEQAPEESTQTPEESTQAPEASTQAPEASTQAPAESSNDTPVQTGDATSAVALAAVVLASLGTAVVMTKKASAKN